MNIKKPPVVHKPIIHTIDGESSMKYTHILIIASPQNQNQEEEERDVLKQSLTIDHGMG